MARSAPTRQPEEAPPRKELRGVVERLTYQNAENGYTVARLAPERPQDEARAGYGLLDGAEARRPKREADQTNPRSGVPGEGARRVPGGGQGCRRSRATRRRRRVPGAAARRVPGGGCPSGPPRASSAASASAGSGRAK